jgi:hypothetical protein
MLEASQLVSTGIWLEVRRKCFCGLEAEDDEILLSSQMGEHDIQQ